MSDFRMIYPDAGFPQVSAADSSPLLPVGFECPARDVAAGTGAAGGFGVFQYCRGSNVASAGQFVQIINGSAVLLAAANSASNFPIGVAAGVLSATNVYGWVQVQGRVDYAKGTNTSNGAGVQRYICAGTPGIVVSNVVAGNRIQGLCVPADQSNTAAVSASGIYDLNRPFCAGLTASL
jgi:hypothetical protein